MNQKLVEYILENKEFPDKETTSIFKVIGLILFSIVALSSFFGYFWQMFETNFDNFNWALSVFVVVAGIFGFWVPLSLKDDIFYFKKFLEIETPFGSQENLNYSIKILEQHFRLRDIDLDKKNLLIQALTKPSIWTWGDAITIVCDNHRLLINSRATGSQPFSYGQQQRHIKKFKDLLKITLANKV